MMGGLGAGGAAAGVGAAVGIAIMGKAATDTAYGAKRLGEITEDTSKSLQLFGDVAAKLESPLNKFVDAIGNFGLFQVEILSKAFFALATVASGTVTNLQNMSDWIADKFGKKDGLAKDKFGEESMADIAARRNQNMNNARGFGGRTLNMTDSGAQIPKVTGGGGMNIQKVEIVVNQTGDANRVARSVVDVLQNMQRNPKVSAYSRNYSASTQR